MQASTSSQSPMTSLVVTNPYNEEIVGQVPMPSSQDVEKVIETAKAGLVAMRQMPTHRRSEILRNTAESIQADKESFASLITAETGKTLRQSNKEVARCVNTLIVSAEEAKRHAGEVISFDSYVGATNRQGYYTREPLGIILAITPYNDPLNLAAHKLGPGLAGGNSIIIKPARVAPLSAQRLVSYFKKSGLPDEALTIIFGGAQALVAARDIRMISFTGGTNTAETITKQAGLKKISGDLGGNAPVIVMDDCDLDSAVTDSVNGAFWAAGQNCIGVQRMLIHDGIYESFVKKFIEATESLVVGDPSSLDTDVGPMISVKDAMRIEQWVDDAIEHGARVLTGHKRTGAIYSPTVLDRVPAAHSIRCEEVFAPVVMLDRFDNLDSAIAEANRSESMLHAAIFTGGLEAALNAADKLEAAGVIINASSDFRLDAMPFGGFKYGSLGREGVRFALEEMTQTKVTCFTRNRPLQDA